LVCLGSADPQDAGCRGQTHDDREATHFFLGPTLAACAGVPRTSRMVALLFHARVTPPFVRISSDWHEHLGMAMEPPSPPQCNAWTALHLQRCMTSVGGMDPDRIIDLGAPGTGKAFRLVDAALGLVRVRQIVAYNLARGRRLRGLTQTDLGERLTALTGTTWSRATVSVAESGWHGKTGRIRHFDVDELVAFGVALDQPASWFLMPPAHGPDGSRISGDAHWITPTKGDQGPFTALSSGNMVSLIRPEEASSQHHPDVRWLEIVNTDRDSGLRVQIQTINHVPKEEEPSLDEAIRQLEQALTTLRRVQAQ
jgi:hypothetical protein